MTNTDTLSTTIRDALLTTLVPIIGTVAITFLGLYLVIMGVRALTHHNTRPRILIILTLGIILLLTGLGAGTWWWTTLRP